MAQDYYYRLSSAFLQVVDAMIEDGAVPERQQWLELAHAPRTSGSEHDCGDVFHGNNAFRAFSWIAL